ncbi:MAG: hypothetical protein JWR83_1407 [Aeromicrobium sp.]|nr:hypothetical protein [Aeromicrobium sp.]
MIDLDITEREAIARGLASAVRRDGVLTATQSDILGAVARALLDVRTPIEQLAPITPAELAEELPDHETRVRALHGMVALEIIAQPVTLEVHNQVVAFAAALGVDEAMLVVAQDYANSAMDQATQDFLRNSYIAEYYGRQDPTTASPAAHKQTDPALAAKWRALESCPGGSHGKTVWDFYQMRGFAFPGTEGAVDPLLAQHDWVHCLADYGTSATGEIEVFTFLGSAIPDPKGFSYCVIILGLFETGYVPFVPGVATARPGHLEQPGGAIRFADALRRGMRLNVDVMGGTDWFETADLPIDEVRRRLGVTPKSAEAVAAGSLSAMDPTAVFSVDT